MKFSYNSGARGRKKRYELGYKSRTIRPYKTMAVLSCLIFSGVGSVSVLTRQQAQPTANAVPQTSLPQLSQAASTTTTAVPNQFANLPTDFTAELQQFLKKRKGAYGIFVGDSNGAVYTQNNADTPFHSASIYKLYVAYLGYQQVDAAKVDGAEVYNSGKTRLQCLDAMIRSSDSPCAEKLASELGKPAIDVKLKAYGLTNTSIRSLTTTARDASRVLSLIQNGTDLSSDSKSRLLDSMLNQQYRNGIPKGFAGATVYNKVGFRDLVEYNDVALVQLSDGRIVTIAIMSEKAGVSSISKVAAEIKRLLK